VFAAPLQPQPPQLAITPSVSPNPGLGGGVMQERGSGRKRQASYICDFVSPLSKHATGHAISAHAPTLKCPCPRWRRTVGL